MVSVADLKIKARPARKHEPPPCIEADRRPLQVGSKLPFPSVTTVKGRVVPFTRTTGERFLARPVQRLY